jgi:hypothetical protein
MSSAIVIAASTNPQGKTLWSIVAKYPRFIHGEVMTHRMFSRNAMSSRAVPVKKILSQVWNSPEMPVHWGANQPGMQAHTELAGWRRTAAQTLWRVSAKVACVFAYGFIKVGLAKQVANRILEPWQTMTTIISGTEWDNFFALRCHPDAQPEFRVLAEQIKEAMDDYLPQQLKEGGWHLPFVTTEQREALGVSDAIKVSAARCARVSYLTHDGQAPNLAADIKLFDRLVGSAPIHASPIEHQAEALGTDTRSNNFIGFAQFRATYERNEIKPR